MMQVLEFVSTLKQQGTTLSAFLDAELKGYYNSGEINSTVKDKAAVLKKLEALFADGEQYHLDGLSVDYPDWHFNVRASNTEPFLRLNLEATTPGKMTEMREKLLAIIRG